MDVIEESCPTYLQQTNQILELLDENTDQYKLEINEIFEDISHKSNLKSSVLEFLQLWDKIESASKALSNSKTPNVTGNVFHYFSQIDKYLTRDVGSKTEQLQKLAVLHKNNFTMLFSKKFKALEKYFRQSNIVSQADFISTLMMINLHIECEFNGMLLSLKNMSCEDGVFAPIFAELHAQIQFTFYAEKLALSKYYLNSLAKKISKIDHNTISTVDLNSQMNTIIHIEIDFFVNNFSNCLVVPKTLKYFEWLFGIYTSLAGSVLYNCVGSHEKLVTFLNELYVFSEKIQDLLENQAILDQFDKTVKFSLRSNSESEMIDLSSDYIVSRFNDTINSSRNIDHINLLNILKKSHGSTEFCYPICQIALNIFNDVYLICSDSFINAYLSIMTKILIQFLLNQEDLILKQSKSVFHAKMFSIANLKTFHSNVSNYSLLGLGNDKPKLKYEYFIEETISKLMHQLISHWYETIDWSDTNSIEKSANILNGACDQFLSSYLQLRTDIVEFQAQAIEIVKEKQNDPIKLDDLLKYLSW